MRRSRQSSKSRLFVLLMIASAVAALLPSRWTEWTRSLLQPLVWAEWSVSAGTGAATDAIEAAAREETVPRVQYDQLEQEVEELRRLLEHQRLTIQTLSERVEDLSGLRGQLRSGGARIILATRIAGDASPGRETITISVGSLRHDIAVGDWVAAGDRLGERERPRGGLEPVQRQWLIGRVSEVQSHRSRVELTTDPQFGPVQVLAAKVAPEGEVQVAETASLLYGAGSGRMVIRSATENYLEAGQTRVVVPLGGAMPVLLSVGEITEARVRPESSLHYDLSVRPPADPRDVTDVYVIVLRP